MSPLATYRLHAWPHDAVTVDLREVAAVSRGQGTSSRIVLRSGHALTVDEDADLVARQWHSVVEREDQHG